LFSARGRKLARLFHHAHGEIMGPNGNNANPLFFGRFGGLAGLSAVRASHGCATVGRSKEDGTMFRPTHVCTAKWRIAIRLIEALRGAGYECELHPALIRRRQRAEGLS
jgi:hypothetical protein